MRFVLVKAEINLWRDFFLFMHITLRMNHSGEAVRGLTGFAFDPVVVPFSCLGPSHSHALRTLVHLANQLKNVPNECSRLCFLEWRPRELLPPVPRDYGFPFHKQ